MSSMGEKADNEAIPEALIEYLAHFNGTRDLFECHEVMEEYWKREGKNRHPSLCLGLIQLAVGLYHERRGNRPGARKMLESAIVHLKRSPLSEYGLDRDRLLAETEERLKGLHSSGHEDGSGYADFNMPVADGELLALCRKRCAEVGAEWLQPSPMDRDELIHRHKLRDRSDVIRIRQERLAAKSVDRKSR